MAHCESLPWQNKLASCHGQATANSKTGTCEVSEDSKRAPNDRRDPGET